MSTEVPAEGPGPKYWQNRADYTINATLDTTRHRISGSVLITYTNNSPDTLPFLWLQLDQNIYRADSRSVSYLGSKRRTFQQPQRDPGIRDQRGKHYTGWQKP